MEDIHASVSALQYYSSVQPSVRYCVLAIMIYGRQKLQKEILIHVLQCNLLSNMTILDR